MYLGIDLGTSNSAIVGNDKGNLRLFKTPDNTDVLPSAILFDRRGNMLVGNRAYDQAAFSPDNVARRFKRLMGTSNPINFAVGKTMTPEEASAEVLKALIAQARMAAGDISIEGAVITIPAAFDQMQSEATMRAATAAGLENVALLQEPIAAALASIASSKNKSGQFLVYDLGGGTFDAALVQAISGSANVIGHNGINMLGGGNFDTAILNAIVRPWLLDHFDLPDDFQKEKKYQRLIRVAQYRIELSKIALSTQLTDRVFADEVQLNAKDRSDADIYLDVEISREQLSDLIIEDVDRSIDLCRKIISDSGYKNEDIDRVVLIGGPSRMPLVRERISRELGIRADLDIDPMTAVATGAAIYAEGLEWTKKGAGAKKSRKSSSTKGPISLQYNYPERTADTQFRLRINARDESQTKGVRIQISSDEGWTSGQVSLEQTKDVRDIPLNRIGDNHFKISVFDALGAPRPESIAEISVRRVGATASGTPMPHNLGVKIVDNLHGSEQNVLHVFVTKGTVLPKSGAEPYRAARSLRAGDDGFLEVELFQLRTDVTDPSLNLPIGVFRLSSSLLDRGEIIQRGDDVIIHWSIDENGLLDCEISIPAISRTFKTDKMYVSTTGHKNYEGEDGFRFASNALDEARADVEALDRALGSQVKNEIAKLRSDIAKQRENLNLSVESETKRSVSEESLLVRQEVARIKARPEFAISALRSELDEFLSWIAEHFTAQFDQKLNTQIQRLAAHARDSLMRATPTSLEDARQSLNEIRNLTFDELSKHPGFWVGAFENLSDDAHLAIDKELHARLIREGQSAIQNTDLSTLRNTYFLMLKNQVRADSPTSPDSLSGITRR